MDWGRHFEFRGKNLTDAGADEGFENHHCNLIDVYFAGKPATMSLCTGYNDQRLLEQLLSEDDPTRR